MKITLDLVLELLSSYRSSLQILSSDTLIKEIRKTINELSELYKWVIIKAAQ